MNNKKKNGESFGEKTKRSMQQFGNKMNKAIDAFRQDENVEGIRKFATKHKRDTIVYVILLIGLLISLFRPFWGHIIIGIVVGLYFAEELVMGSRKLNDFIERQGIFRIVIFCFLGIALFLAAPGICIGAAIGIGFKLLLSPKSTK